MKTIEPVHKVQFELDKDDLNEMILDYYKKKLGTTLNIKTIKWDIKEKVVGTYLLNHLESEDIMGFSHILVEAQLDKK